MTTEAHRERLTLALGAGVEAGLGLRTMFPATLRGLHHLGVPVRPLHYMPTTVLFLWLFLALSVAFVVFYWLMLDVSGVTRGETPVGKMRVISVIYANGSYGMILLMSGGLALVTALSIRFQAMIYRLPRWHEL